MVFWHYVTEWGKALWDTLLFENLGNMLKVTFGNVIRNMLAKLPVHCCNSIT